jgi:hypothetical protein
MIHHDEHSRFWVYLLVALTALLTGYFIGQSSPKPAPDANQDHWPHIVR